jgi:ankyrin repeat protein
MLAVTNAHFELASALLDAGADSNEGVQGWTALHIISDVRKPGTGSNDPAPPGSGTLDSLDLVRRLVAHGAKINARTTRSRNVGLTSLNTDGATPFLLARRAADVELMRLLVSLGANPTIPNAEETTPLMVAAGVGTRSPGEDAGTRTRGAGSR